MPAKEKKLQELLPAMSSRGRRWRILTSRLMSGVLWHLNALTSSRCHLSPCQAFLVDVLRHIRPGADQGKYNNHSAAIVVQYSMP